MYKYIKTASLFFVVLYLGGCSSGISGEYGGDDCIYGMNFKSDGKVYITATIFGVKSPESAGTYEVDGERVIVRSSDGQSVVFRKKGDSLVTDFIGDEMECKKL